MVSKKKSCGCKGSKRCHRCKGDHPKVYINPVESTGKSKCVVKLSDCENKWHDEVCVKQKSVCVICEREVCICHHNDKDCRDVCVKQECTCTRCVKQKCEHEESHKCQHDMCKKQHCTCCHCVKKSGKCSTCEREICICIQKHECRCMEHKCHTGDCKRHTVICGCEDLYEDKCEEGPKHCPEEIKGMDLCRKKEEMKCFKHCAPISQPCDCHSYNHFTSRANLEFSGLVVVKNTSNPTGGCSMEVCVTDGCGTDLVAVVTPGSSVPVFVEGLISLDIACGREGCKQPGPGTCNGEVIFDLEYCTTKYVAHHDECC